MNLWLAITVAIVCGLALGYLIIRVLLAIDDCLIGCMEDEEDDE